jgi:ABC-type polysaccharide/polyol phosphate export permease
VGRLLFDVPVRGSVFDLYLAAAAFIAANLSLGLFISTAARTQFQAMQMTIFILLPSILLSGFMFPFDGMPRFAQLLGELLPNTHFIRLTRGIMLREAGIGDLLSEILFLCGFTLVAMTAAALRCTKRLDSDFRLYLRLSDHRPFIIGAILVQSCRRIAPIPRFGAESAIAAPEETWFHNRNKLRLFLS